MGNGDCVHCGLGGHYSWICDKKPTHNYSYGPGFDLMKPLKADRKRPFFRIKIKWSCFK